jgi:hypothetical protein
MEGPEDGDEPLPSCRLRGHNQCARKPFSLLAAVHDAKYPTVATLTFSAEHAAAATAGCHPCLAHAVKASATPALRLAWRERRRRKDAIGPPSLAGLLFRARESTSPGPPGRLLVRWCHVWQVSPRSRRSARPGLWGTAVESGLHGRVLLRVGMYLVGRLPFSDGTSIDNHS